MRIIHVIDYFQPKLGYQETFLAKMQSEMKNDVYVLTSDRYDPFLFQGNTAKKILGERIKGSGFFMEEGIKTIRLKTYFETSYTIWLAGLENGILELNPDIVYVHGISSISAIRIGNLKSKHFGFKLIYDDHATLDNSKSKLYPLFRFLFSGLIKTAGDAFVGILPDTRDFMNKKYGIPYEDIHIIPLGADEDLFKFDEAARREMRHMFLLSDDDIAFIYTGKIISLRRLDLLIDAITFIKQNELIKIIILGDGPSKYVNDLRKQIKLKDLENKFVWHPAVPNDQLPKYYSAADVAVWPFGASASILEAMSCGLPIILSEKSMVTELVRNGNGFLFKEDAMDLARQMEKFLDIKLIKEMGFKSRKLVIEELSWKVIAKQFLDLAM